VLELEPSFDVVGDCHHRFVVVRLVLEKHRGRDLLGKEEAEVSHYSVNDFSSLVGKLFQTAVHIDKLSVHFFLYRAVTIISSFFALKLYSFITFYSDM